MHIKEESQLVPYDVSPLPKGPWLVFAPHADDETFGMGGSLLLAAQQDIPIILVIMTDGKLGGPDSDGRLATTRADEARAVASALGNAEVIFLDQPDRLLTVSEALIEGVADIIKQRDAMSLFLPAPTEYHPDHRVTTQLVWAGQQRANFQGGCFAYDISAQGAINMMIDTTTMVDEKRRLMSLYQSQLSQNNYLDVVASLDRARSYTLPPGSTHAEGFFRFPANTGASLMPQIESHLRQYGEGIFPECPLGVTTEGAWLRWFKRFLK